MRKIEGGLPILPFHAIECLDPSESPGEGHFSATACRLSVYR
jgi:hypothetical protein